MARASMAINRQNDNRGHVFIIIELQWYVCIWLKWTGYFSEALV
jgi:hypothetical protein